MNAYYNHNILLVWLVYVLLVLIEVSDTYAYYNHDTYDTYAYYNHDRILKNKLVQKAIIINGD